MPSFYIPDFNSQQGRFIISGEEYHHLTKVRRLKQNDIISITNGQGLLASSKIIEINKKEAVIEIISIREEKKSEPLLAIAFSLLKNKNDHMIIEKLTEMGIKEFFPIVTERSVRQPNKNILDKFVKVAIAAIKQSDNAFLPSIHSVKDLRKLIEELEHSEYEIMVASESEKNEYLYSKLEKSDRKKICIIIGPEGGFSKSEQDYFEDNNISTITLGNHVVRAETAAIVAASQILNFYLLKNPDYY